MRSACTCILMCQDESPIRPLHLHACVFSPLCQVGSPYIDRILPPPSRTLGVAASFAQLLLSRSWESFFETSRIRHTPEPVEDMQIYPLDLWRLRLKRARKRTFCLCYISNLVSRALYKFLNLPPACGAILTTSVLFGLDRAHLIYYGIGVTSDSNSLLTRGQKKFRGPSYLIHFHLFPII